MKKRVIIMVAGLLCGMFVLGISKTSNYIEINRAKHCLIVKEGKFSGYSYAVYEDHVELLKYQGSKKDVDIPQTLMGKPVTVIGEECFCDTQITSVNLKSDVMEIGKAAFAICDELESVTGEANVKEIRINAFINCQNLKTVEIGHNIRKIGAYAFDGCDSLESLGEQPKLEIIGDNAFQDAGILNDFHVLESTHVGNFAFVSSKWLKNKTEEFVIVGEGSLLMYNGDKTIVTIPDGVKKIDSFTFKYGKDQEKIQEIYVSETVEELVSLAFDGLGNIVVYIPESVTAIDEDFQGIGQNSAINGLTGDNSNIKIVTTKGSYAEKYAKKYHLRCEIVDGWEVPE